MRVAVAGSGGGVGVSGRRQWKPRDEQERLKERFAEILATVRERLIEAGKLPVTAAQDGEEKR